MPPDPKEQIDIEMHGRRLQAIFLGSPAIRLIKRQIDFKNGKKLGG
jgi:hypothetical protein